MNPDDVAHLAPERMARAQRAQVAKMLAELAHERLVEPRPDGTGWEVVGDDPAVRYWFRARLLPLDHWLVDPTSVHRRVSGVEQRLDAQALVLELRDQLAISDQVLPAYLEEIASTLAGRCLKDSPDALTAAELVHADFQEIEAAMSEGHPCFLANNGRIGFAVDDVHAFAPETGARTRLVWLAVHRAHAGFSAVEGLDHDALVAAELDADLRGRFEKQLRERGLDPADYLWMPCHPWQWRHKVAVTFAPEVAEGLVVPLGESTDDYQPQQSIRTFFNASTPQRRYVKTALSVLNMGFLRGLSARYMDATPLINAFVDDLVRSDPTLQGCGFEVLREVAAVGFRPPAQTAAAEVTGATPYTRMLAALWRESPVHRVGPGERLATMASLLHVDNEGTPLVAELVRASGLAPSDWLRRYLDAYLVPVLHSLFRHGLVFMPHGENVILVLRDHVPTRVLMKDIGEEVAVCFPETPVPAGAERIRAEVDDEALLLAVQSDVFDCYLRFLAARLDEAGVLTARECWVEVAACVHRYQAAHPELAGTFERLDLFTGEVPLMCMNRLQLRNNQEMVDLADPASAVKVVGRMRNPLVAPASSAAPGPPGSGWCGRPGARPRR